MINLHKFINKALDRVSQVDKLVNVGPTGCGNTRPGLTPCRRRIHAQGCCEYHPRFSLPHRSVGDLADEIGKLCAEIADLEGRRKNFREELIRRGVAEAEGALFRATVSDAVRWTIDSALVKAEMGVAWWDARCRQSLVTTVAVKARTGFTKLAA
jgi:hypothetical protein